MSGRHSGAVHSVVFHPPADDEDAQRNEARLDLAACMSDIVSVIEPGGLLLFPAGFLRAPTVEACDGLAGAMREVAERTGVSMVFGVDVGSPRLAVGAGLPGSLVFACSGRHRLLWPGRHCGGSDHDGGPAEDRCIPLQGFEVGVVIGSEVFNAPLRRALVSGRPDVILLLTHLGPTERWSPALSGLSAIAPLVLAGESLTQGIPPWARAPVGWSRDLVGGTSTVTLASYRRETADRPHGTCSGGGAEAGYAQ